jgi:predicted anti-sigma-YlaC factor YlaD
MNILGFSLPASLRRFAPVVLVLLLTGCSVKRFAINKLGDSLAKSGANYSSDNDPELVGQALPFSLKLIEGLLEESPKHTGLLFAASSGFTQYSYVYVQEQADELEASDIARSTQLRIRARKLYLRATNYGLRALETRHPGFETLLRKNPRTAARSLRPSDVPAAYWTAVAWTAAISVSKDKPEIVAEQPLAEAIIDRVTALDPDYEHGAVDGFLIAYEPARQDANGGYAERCRRHFQRAVVLSGGSSAAPYVAMAEAVAIPKQDRSLFETLLRKAIAIDSDEKPAWRLANLVYQRRARWLLSRADDLFAEPAPSAVGNNNANQETSK